MTANGEPCGTLPCRSPVAGGSTALAGPGGSRPVPSALAGGSIALAGPGDSGPTSSLHAPGPGQPARTVSPRPATPRGARQRGQASVELVALLPLVAVVALAAVTILASHVAQEQAGEAAEAGALAVLQGGVDPKEAAEEALPPAARERATITVTDRRVRVRVRAQVVLPIPGLAEQLAGDIRADAGR